MLFIDLVILQIVKTYMFGTQTTVFHIADKGILLN